MVIYNICIVIAWLIAFASWLFVSQATSGVAGMCFACFLVISARLVQAERHHQQLVERLGARTL